MTNLALIVAILLFTGQTICFKIFNEKYMKNLTSYFLFLFLYSSFAALIYFITTGSAATYSSYTIILGSFFGILLILAVLFYMKALETGPLSYSALFFSSGLVLPIVFGLIFWDEKVSPPQAIGVVLLIITFYLASQSSSDENLNISSKWLMFCILAFICNGLLMILLKAQQIEMAGKEIGEFLSVAFSVSAIIALIVFFVYKGVKGESIDHVKHMPFIWLVICTGSCISIGNGLSSYLASRLPSIIHFPMINGGVVVLSSILSSLVFKEKIDRKGHIGLVCGLIALVFLSV